MSHTTAAAALTVGQAPYNVLFILTVQERYFRPGELPRDYRLPGHERLTARRCREGLTAAGWRLTRSRTSEFGPCRKCLGEHGGMAPARVGLPGPNRTGNLPLRRRVLYPVELRAVAVAAGAILGSGAPSLL